MEPALEGQAAFLHIKREVVDVERAGCDHLDGFVVPHQSIMRHVHVRYVRRLPHVNAAGEKRPFVNESACRTTEEQLTLAAADLTTH